MVHNHYSRIKRHIMLDIETLSSTSNAVMIQIAAIEFNPQTGEEISTFNGYLDRNMSSNLGMVESQNTLDWWKVENEELLQSILSKGQGVDPKDTMKDFMKFIDDPFECLVWSHATFDFVIVQNYLTKTKNRKMAFKNAMDLRTLVYLSGIDLSSYDWSGKTHDALDDCRFQIKFTVDSMNALNNK